MGGVCSQNGWSANDRSVIAQYTVPGSTRKIALRKGDVSVVLLDLLGWMHANIRKIDVGVYDDWGYAERTIRGSSTTLSNHASGTAVDFDATQHPLGVKNTWHPAEVDQIHGRLKFYEGAIRWGRDYTGRVDEMHFEINAGGAAVGHIANKIRGGVVPPAQTLDEEDEMAAVVLNLPAGNGQRQLVGVPPFVPGTATLYMWTGWTDATIRAGYFVRDRGPGLTPQQEGWGGTGAFRMVQNDRPKWPLPDGCTGVGLEYDSGHPISVTVVYKPA